MSQLDQHLEAKRTRERLRDRYATLATSRNPGLRGGHRETERFAAWKDLSRHIDWMAQQGWA